MLISYTCIILAPEPNDIRMKTEWKPNMKNNFKRYPYYGVFTKIAEDQDKSADAIRMAYARNNPDIVAVVDAEIRRRKRIVGNKEHVRA